MIGLVFAYVGMTVLAFAAGAVLLAFVENVQDRLAARKRGHR